MTTIRFVSAAAVLALIAGAALAEPPIKEGDSALGKILTDDNGMTLYTFDKDADGMSACYDKCAQNWPPLAADASATAEGDYGITERKDGSKQWTYDGKPLYLWVKDAAPGDVTGDGVNDVWHVVKEDY